MTAIIDVALAVDTQSLINDYPALSQDPRHPTIIAGGYCYLFGAEASVSRGQASDRMSITAPAGNSPVALRLRALSLSGNSDTAAVIHSIVSTRCTGTRKPVLGPFVPHEASVETPLPIIVRGGNTDPPSFDVQTVTDYFEQSSLVRPGRLDLQIGFYLTVPNQASAMPECVGFCVWPTLMTVVVPDAPPQE